MTSEVTATPLPQLLLNEAILLFEKQYEGALDKDPKIETAVRLLGRKPGFAMIAQLIRDRDDFTDVDDIMKFIGSTFSTTLFGAMPFTEYDGKTKKFVKYTFTKQPPSYMSCLCTPKTPTSPKITFWFRCYAYFIIGVYQGAFLHFGYKTLPSMEIREGWILSISFHVIKINDQLEFMASVPK